MRSVRRPMLVVLMPVVASVVASALASCGGDDEPVARRESAAATTVVTATDTAATDTAATTTAPDGDGIFPDVLDATATFDDGAGTWTFSVTLSSPYDTPERYADAWRVLGPDGTELGVRILAHDHAGEQPFTRSLDGVEIPDEVDAVTIEGRDQVNGYGGATVTVELVRS